MGGKKKVCSDTMPPARIHRIRSDVFTAENSPSCLSWTLPTFLIPCFSIPCRLFWYLPGYLTAQGRVVQHHHPPPPSASEHCILLCTVVWKSTKTECFDSLSVMTMTFPKWKEQEKGMKPGDNRSVYSYGLLFFLFVSCWKWDLSGKEKKKRNENTVTIKI